MTEKKSITAEDRTIDYLKKTVQSIYRYLFETISIISKKYPDLHRDLPKEITFITSQELEDMYPDVAPDDREFLIAKKYKAVFIIWIWDKLKSGIVHWMRSPDYDDWTLDGDWIVYDEKFDRKIELSSMWIRVSEKSLVQQLIKARKL